MLKSVEQRHINLCEEAIINKKGKVELAKDLYICVDNDIIHFRCDEIPAEPWDAEVKDNCFSSPYGVYRFLPSTDKDGIDADKIKGVLSASSRRDGDRIFIKKRKVTKSLKKVFNEMQIPTAKRNEYAVLRDGDSIIWVEGIGTDGKYLPDDRSKNVFKVVKDVENYA